MVRVIMIYIILFLLTSCNRNQSIDNRILMHHNYKKAVFIPSGLEKLFRNINFDTIRVSSIKEKDVTLISNQEYVEFLYKQDSINKSYDDVEKASGILKDTTDVSFSFYAIGKFKSTKNIVSLIVLLERISKKRLLNRYDDAIFILNLKSYNLCSIADIADNKGAFSNHQDNYITTFVRNRYFKKERCASFVMDYLVYEKDKSWFQEQWDILKDRFNHRNNNPYSSFEIAANGQIKFR